MSTNETDKRFSPTRQVCRRYSISGRTLARWERDPNLRFPKALIINKRKYYNEAELSAFDRARAGQR